MKTKGFTLIEVLIALMLVSISIVALIKAQEQSSKTLFHLNIKTLASLVAANLAVENRLGKKSALGYQSGEYKLAKNTWYWQTFTQKTADKSIYEQTISVFQNKTKKNAKETTSSLKIYLLK